MPPGIFILDKRTDCLYYVDNLLRRDRMKLSINSGYIIRTLGIDEGFRQIAQSGFSGVDLDLCHFLPIRWPFDRPVEPTPYETMSDEALLESVRPYKEAAEKYGVAISQAHAVDPPYIAIEETDERLLRVLKRTVMVCGYLGCRYLIIHPAHCEYDAKILTPEEEWAANMHMYGELIPYLKKYDVIACLENMYTEHAGRCMTSICQEPLEANRYIDALNEMAGEERFAFCLDTGHAFMVGMQIDRVIRTLGHRLQTLHLNDNDGMGDQHQMPYTGMLDWAIVYRALREIGYKGMLNFELKMNFEKEILPAAMDFVAATGRMFAGKIME